MKIFENSKNNLMYSDTDSLVYDIRHPDIYDCINNHSMNFDLSDSKQADLKDDANKKVGPVFATAAEKAEVLWVEIKRRNDLVSAWLDSFRTEAVS